MNAYIIIVQLQNEPFISLLHKQIKMIKMI